MFGEAGNCRYELLSYAERDQIRAGLAEMHRGHLVDVEGTTMTLRDARGTRRVEVPEGAVFVNCTSHLRQLP